MSVQDHNLPGPAPFNWNTGNGTAGPVAGIAGSSPDQAAPAAPAIPAPAAPSAPAPGASSGGIPSASDNPGFGGLQFSPPPSGSTSTATSTPSASTAPTNAAEPTHTAGLSSTPIPGAAPMGAIAYDDGGSVGGQDDVTAAVNQAMDTVSSLFDFGRQKHGLTQGGGDQAPMGPTWGQMPNTSGNPGSPPASPNDTTGGSKYPGEIQPTPLHDDQSDKGYNNPTMTGLPPPQVQGAAEGGTIDDDAGGPDVADAADQSQQQPQQGVPDQAQTAQQGAGGNPKRAIGYLTGEGAAPNEAIMKLEQQVDPQGRMSPEIRKLLAVHAASEQGGPEAGWSAMQHYRQRFLMLNGLAAAQLKGNQQKPPNPAMAAKTATDAYSNSLDGNKITFQPHPQGMAVHVQPYKRPAQPAMGGGGAIPSYDSGGSVDDSNDTTGSVSQDNTQTRGGIPITRQGAINQPSQPEQDQGDNNTSPWGVKMDFGKLIPPPGSMGSGINLPTDQAVKVLSDAAAHDKIQELGLDKFLNSGVNMAGQTAPGQSQPDQGGVNMAGPQPQAPTQPATPPTPAATEGAPTPTGKVEATDQAIKGGAAEQPTKPEKEDYKGKLVRLGGDNGPMVYENLWKLANRQFPWASQQSQAMDMYHRLAAGEKADEAKLAAAELSGVTKKEVATATGASRERVADKGLEKTKYAVDTKAGWENRRTDANVQNAMRKEATAMAQGDKNREQRLLRSLMNAKPGEIPQDVSDRIQGHLDHAMGAGGGQGGEAEGATLGGAQHTSKAANDAQGNMKALSQVGKLPKVTTQEQFDALQSGQQYISTDGQPHRKP